MDKATFQELVWQKGRELYRDMPWRRSTDPYYVLVSEVMLQQTQVDRVIPKFNTFIEQFPDVQSLSASTLDGVLRAWSGLGYNRRAKFLHVAAKTIMSDYNGVIPSTVSELIRLPGVGQNTAGAILAYSFNQPVVFIETNIRSVYFHHFFKDNHSVTDSQLRELVEATLDHEHPREWYQALMDYGVQLKKQGLGQIGKSMHYKKQPPLVGSSREVRGQIVRCLAHSDMSLQNLRDELVADDRFDLALDGLIKEGLVGRTNGKLHLTK
jgi:A/G-specific adenine glycosylase